MTKILLVRHGETYENVQQILQGQMQGRLNDHGIRQAEMLRDQLAATHLDAIVASDLQRAVDTATIIAQPHQLAVGTTPLLRERDWGDLTGASIPAVRDVEWPDNVETLEQLKSRARTLLRQLAAEYPCHTVLVVGHGIINKAIQSVFYHKPMNEVRRMDNGEVRVIKSPSPDPSPKGSGVEGRP